MTPTDTLEPKALEALARLRFFRDLTTVERHKIFEVFGVPKVVVEELRSHVHESAVFKRLFFPTLSTASIPPDADSNETANHAINELADCVCNVIQLLKNVRAGITDPDVAVKRAEDNYEYAIGVAHAAQAAQPVEGETK